MQLARLNPGAMMLFSAASRRAALLHPSAIVRVTARAVEEGLDAQLLGATGKCVRYLPRESRMVVDLLSEPGRLLRVRVEDLLLSEERDVATEEGAPSTVCHAPDCDQPGTKRCVRCLAALYCGRVCQQRDWKAHKQDCKQSAGKKVKLPVAPPAAEAGPSVSPSSLGVSELPSNMRVATIPWGSSTEHHTDLGSAAAAAGGGKARPASKHAEAKQRAAAAQQEPGGAPDQAFRTTIVKVQVPFGTDATAQLMVYDRTRQWQRLLGSQHPQYAAIRRSVQDGALQHKAYFHATLSDRGEVAFSLEQQAPPQDW